MNTNECWDCGRKMWICELRHFWGPIFSGAFEGALWGIGIGLVLSGLTHLLQWATN